MTFEGLILCLSVIPKPRWANDRRQLYRDFIATPVLRSIERQSKQTIQLFSGNSCCDEYFPSCHSTINTPQYSI
jgi:hypothetical protein